MGWSGGLKGGCVVWLVDQSWMDCGWVVGPMGLMVGMSHVGDGDLCVDWSWGIGVSVWFVGTG